MDLDGQGDMALVESRGLVAFAPVEERKDIGNDSLQTRLRCRRLDEIRQGQRLGREEQKHRGRRQVDQSWAQSRNGGTPSVAD
jgi:hypothetical protein